MFYHYLRCWLSIDSVLCWGLVFVSDICEIKWIGLWATFVHIKAKLGQENLLRMVRWMRWHCPPDTGFEIRALAVWGRARYLSVTEAPHNTEFHTWMGKKHVCFFQTAQIGNRTPNSSVKGSGANHYPRAPALFFTILTRSRTLWLHLTLTLTTLIFFVKFMMTKCVLFVLKSS